MLECKDCYFFCGGQARYGKDPERTCEISASKWVADLESRTKFNFTDEGRRELAKQYMIGTAKSVLTLAMQKWVRLEWSKRSNKGGLSRGG